MKISIVIPTRERALYLRQSLATALAIDDPDVEIIVTDNESTDDTAAVVAAHSDPRLKYVKTGARVSMRQNFENGMRQVTGDYVIFFGDDDGILPGQFRFLRRLLEERQPDALSWSLPTYGWPIEGFGKRTGTDCRGWFFNPYRPAVERPLSAPVAALLRPFVVRALRQMVAGP